MKKGPIESNEHPQYKNVKELLEALQEEIPELEKHFGYIIMQIESEHHVPQDVIVRQIKGLCFPKEGWYTNMHENILKISRESLEKMLNFIRDYHASMPRDLKKQSKVDSLMKQVYDEELLTKGYEHIQFDENAENSTKAGDAVDMGNNMYLYSKEPHGPHKTISHHNFHSYDSIAMEMEYLLNKMAFGNIDSSSHISLRGVQTLDENKDNIISTYGCESELATNSTLQTIWFESLDTVEFMKREGPRMMEQLQKTDERFIPLKKGKYSIKLWNQAWDEIRHECMQLSHKAKSRLVEFLAKKLLNFARISPETKLNHQILHQWGNEFMQSIKASKLPMVDLSANDAQMAIDSVQSYKENGVTSISDPTKRALLHHASSTETIHESSPQQRIVEEMKDPKEREIGVTEEQAQAIQTIPQHDKILADLPTVGLDKSIQTQDKKEQAKLEGRVKETLKSVLEGVSDFAKEAGFITSLRIRNALNRITAEITKLLTSMLEFLSDEEVQAYAHELFVIITDYIKDYIETHTEEDDKPGIKVKAELKALKELGKQFLQIRRFHKNIRHSIHKEIGSRQAEILDIAEKLTSKLRETVSTVHKRELSDISVDDTKRVFATAIFDSLEKNYKKTKKGLKTMKREKGFLAQEFRELGDMMTQGPESHLLVMKKVQTVLDQLDKQEKTTERDELLKQVFKFAYKHQREWAKFEPEQWAKLKNTLTAYGLEKVPPEVKLIARLTLLMKNGPQKKKPVEKDELTVKIA